MRLAPQTEETASSPRSRRRRRQQTQQVRCCGCLLLAAILIAALAPLAGRVGAWRHQRRQAREQALRYTFPLELTVSARRFWRYQLVPITLRLSDAQGRPAVAAAAPQVIVRFGQDPVVTVGNLSKLTPRYRAATQEYVCYWPIPRMATPGVYLVTARVPLQDPGQWRWNAPKLPTDPLPQAGSPAPRPPSGPTYCVAQAAIEIVQRPPPAFPPGTCFATWEENFPTGPVPLPRGGQGDWRALLEWCKFMGADTLLFRGAVTSAQQFPLTREQPFVAANLQALPRLAAEAHRQGLKFGAWAVAYETLPTSDNRGKPPYQYAQDISRSTGRASSLDFISLLDQQRRSDLAGFLRQMQADENVDFVGLDYLRSDVGGWEMTNTFTSEMPVKLPPNWGQMDQQRRWLFMANKIEHEWQTDRDFYDLWNWWRTHLGSEIIAQLIRDSELQKPLLAFVLSWQHGVQHGQDPAMFTDAGVTVLLPMLYQVAGQAHFQAMMRAWNDYLTPGQANLAPGDQVDDFWHQRSRSPASPELLYQRMMAAQERMIRGGRPLGAFWHDLSRAALRGNLGPYPGTEWALAGGAAFSQVRQAWGVYPLRFALSCPQVVQFGVPFTARLTVENISGQSLRNISLRLENTVRVAPADGGRKSLPLLGPGEKIDTPLPVTVTGPEGARANRFMIAVRAEWAARDYGPQFRADLPAMFLLMQYVRASASGG